MFGALADRNVKVIEHLKHFIAFGPVAQVSHITSPMFKELAHSEFVQTLEVMGINDVFGYNWIDHPFTEEYCAQYGVVCRDFL